MIITSKYNPHEDQLVIMAKNDAIMDYTVYMIMPTYQYCYKKEHLTMKSTRRLIMIPSHNAEKISLFSGFGATSQLNMVNQLFEGFSSHSDTHILDQYDRTQKLIWSGRSCAFAIAWNKSNACLSTHEANRKMRSFLGCINTNEGVNSRSNPEVDALLVR